MAQDKFTVVVMGKDGAVIVSEFDTIAGGVVAYRKETLLLAKEMVYVKQAPSYYEQLEATQGVALFSPTWVELFKTILYPWNR